MPMIIKYTSDKIHIVEALLRMLRILAFDSSSFNSKLESSVDIPFRAGDRSVYQETRPRIQNLQPRHMHSHSQDHFACIQVD
jgi:hypothetical protein